MESGGAGGCVHLQGPEISRTGCTTISGKWLAQLQCADGAPGNCRKLHYLAWIWCADGAPGKSRKLQFGNASNVVSEMGFGRQGADDCEQEEVLLPHSHANARRLHHHHRHHSSGSRGSSQPEQDDRGRGYSGGLQTHEDDDRWHMDGSSGVQGEGQGGVSGGAAGEPGAVKNVALGGGTASGRLRRFECPECGFVGEMTGVQVLRHKRMHAKH
eukprot:scaffold180807_cov19-Tisochrysis_lutea.AAC.1